MKNKIAILVPDLSLGGGQRVALNTAQLLATNYEIHIVVFNKNNQLFTTDLKIINLNIPKKETRWGKLFTVYNRVKSFKKLIKKEKYDVTISFLESANLCAFLSHRNKCIITLHGAPDILTTFDRLALRYLFKYCKNIIAVSNGLKSAIEHEYRLKNVTVINNSINHYETNRLAKAFYFSHPRKFIVAVGRLSEVKQFDLMIDIFSRSKARNEFDLLIIGDGKLREELNKKLKNGLDSIQLLGEKSNPFPIIKAAELLIMTSKHEAFPMVLLESLSLETPVMAFDCPTGPRDIISNNKNGILIESNNKEEFIKKLDTVLFSPEMLDNLATHSKPSVEKFSTNKILNLWNQQITPFLN